MWRLYFVAALQHDLRLTFFNDEGVCFFNFAMSYFQILFYGPRMVWRYDAKIVKIEVPHNVMKRIYLFFILFFASLAQGQVLSDNKIWVTFADTSTVLLDEKQQTSLVSILFLMNMTLQKLPLYFPLQRHHC